VPLQTRRDFLRTAAASQLGRCRCLAQEEPEVVLRLPEHPRCIPTMWLGAVTSTTATVKTKLPAGSARAALRSASSVARPTPCRSSLRARRAANVAVFRIRGLQPSTIYTYTLEVNGRPSYYPPGRLRTFPPEGKADLR
jgi:hypothetical protein